ncbi:ion channel [Pontibacter ummariensis]|uniref:Ion channel n=1 Tax=Pontibacter ummariensis TaxID=1610492 RepID=A0A239DQB7_9BACT|nr:potassium channel family protein [Pontibacter ummariensis]PRY13803.1 ion channel [Pontibacter ummariensis]SNS34716.1 Ion channel [Pontibacter ummariensis]
MNFLYFALGALVFAITALDIIKTALSSNGGGMVTSLVSRAVYKAFFLAAGKRGKSRLLSYAGPAVLVSVLLVWVLGFWSGLFLALLSDPGSVVHSVTKTNASAVEKLYYAGFTLSTLGVGDYVASSDFWRIVTDVAAYSGLVFITTSITYFLPVLSAVSLQSTLSLYISGMGKTPQQILIKSWNGKDFSSFFDNTSDLCQMLIKHTMNHHSYPVIHYFHNSQPKLSVAPAIVLLDEAYQLLGNALQQDVPVDEVKMSMLQTTLDSYLEVVKGSFLKHPSPNEKAPLPDLKQLEEKGVPLKGKETVRQHFEQALQERRRLLTSLLEMDGWSWKEVYQPG